MEIFRYVLRVSTFFYSQTIKEKICFEVLYIGQIFIRRAEKIYKCILYFDCRHLFSLTIFCSRFKLKTKELVFWDCELIQRCSKFDPSVKMTGQPFKM